MLLSASVKTLARVDPDFSFKARVGIWSGICLLAFICDHENALVSFTLPAKTTVDRYKQGLATTQWKSTTENTFDAVNWDDIGFARSKELIVLRRGLAFSWKEILLKYRGNQVVHAMFSVLAKLDT